ncbi:glycosyltransferase family 2 protein, partial [Actinoallomurus soli]|uniref:glycosyltransferase family 2 protein n=1 Tax=Actinoallomurus soli TaxID=2952535 RepID=UPI0020923DE7
ADQTQPPTQVIVVDQSHTTDTATVIDTYRDRLPLRRITSDRGASLGRNTGLAALDPDYDIVAFPDDDVRLAPDALANAAAAFATGDHIGVVSGAVIFPGGYRSHRIAGGHRTVLNKATVRTNTIEASCFFSARFLRSVGGFDETLGVGNPTPWQSTAGLDLLLRGVRRGWTVLFDPAILVYETGYNGTPEDHLYRIKCRHYARGTGRVYRRHYGPGTVALILGRQAGGVVYFLLTGRGRRAAWCLQQVIGLVEGLTGRLLNEVKAPEPLEARRFYDTSARSTTGTGAPHE